MDINPREEALRRQEEIIRKHLQRIQEEERKHRQRKRTDVHRGETLTFSDL